MSAVQELAESLMSARALITLEQSYQDPPSLTDRPTVLALRGSCVLLTVASFEQFLKTLFEEELDKIIASKTPLSLLPEKFRIEAYYASLDLALNGDHDTKGVGRAGRLDEIRRTARVVSSDSFLPRALSRTYSNPGSDCVKRMFKLVGYQDPVRAIQDRFEQKWPSAVTSSFVIDKLDSVVSARNTVAHTADAAHIARSELEGYVSFIETLGETLAELLNDHVSCLLSSATGTP
jgi:hypothetical protein